jgi:PAS domain S-box-containing protein
VFAEVDFRLLDLLPVPASAHNRDGKYVWLNKAGEALSGLRNEEIRGNDVLQLVPDPWNTRAREEIERCLEEQTPREYNSAFRRKGDNVLVAVTVRLLPLVEDGASIGFLATAYRGRAAAPDEPGAPRLTPRQMQVLDLLAQGVGTAEIAERLGLSRETVRNHIQAVLKAVQASSRVEAIAKARRFGLLPPIALALVLWIKTASLIGSAGPTLHGL